MLTSYRVMYAVFFLCFLFFYFFLASTAYCRYVNPRGLFLSATDYLYIGDYTLEKKKSSSIPLALLLSPDRADMDCSIDRLSREI